MMIECIETLNLAVRAGWNRN